MELLTNDLVIGHIAGNAAAQTLIEGDLPLPAGRQAAAILDYSGELSVAGIEVLKDRLMLDGTLTAELICTDQDGVPFSFRSAAAFHHTVEIPGADAGMDGRALPSLQSLSCTPDNGVVKLSAVADIACRVEDHSPVRVLSGVRDIPDLLLKPLQISSSQRKSVGRAPLRIRGELNAGSIAEVVSVKAQAAVTSLSPASDGIQAEGTVSFCALCREQNNSLIQLNHQLPFREIVPAELSSVPSEAAAQVSGCSLRRIGEGSGALTAEAELSLEFFSYTSSEYSIVTDAYAPSTPMECIAKPLAAFSQYPVLQKRVSLCESVAVPEGWPAVSRSVFADAHPVVTGSSLQNGQLSIDGLLITRIVYECSDGRLHAFSEDVPFLLNAELPAQATDADCIVRCFCASASGSGSAADVSYSLLLEIYPMTMQELLPVTGVAPADAPPPQRGIVLYFAGAGETLWDVAKRFRTTPDALRAANPGLNGELSEGERLLLFLRRSV